MTLFEGPIVAVGKIAGEAEYLRAETDAGALFDAWLDEGFEAGFERWGEEWRGAVRRGGPHAFVWWPCDADRAGGPLCGVLAPSRDAVGRDYPLAVFGHVRAEVAERAPHVLFLALGEFLDEVWGWIDVARTTPMIRSELALRLRELPRPSEDEAARAAADYDEWCQTSRLREGWSAVLPAGGSPPCVDDIVTEIARAAADGLLRLPVGSGGSGAVALWLDVVARILDSRDAVQSAFWGVDSGSLLVTPGSPATSLVGSLWVPEGRVSADVQRSAATRVERDSHPTARVERSMAEFLTSLGLKRGIRLASTNPGPLRWAPEEPIANSLGQGKLAGTAISGRRE